MKQAKFATSGHFLENAREEWPELWHADASWPPSEFFKFWPWSLDFPHFGIILTKWNRSNLGFMALFFRMHGRNGSKFDMQMYPDCIFNCLHFSHGLWIFLILTVFWLSETSQICRFYIWHCVPYILLWSILCKTVGLPSSTGESERTARRQFHSPTLRCFRGRLCEVAAGRGPLKQSRWPESNWTLPLRSVGVAPSLGRFWLVFTALKLRYVLRRHIILSDSDGNQGVLDCFTVYPGLGGSAK